MNSTRIETHNDRIKKVFAGSVAQGWNTKGRLIYQIEGNDNIVYDIITQYGHDKMSVLDVGCATGRLLTYVDSKFRQCNIKGIDISEDMVEYAEKISNSSQNSIYIINDDFVEFDFGQEKFDMIILKFVLHHVEDKYRVLIKAKNLLNKNGMLLLYTPSINYLKEVFINGNEKEDILGRLSLQEVKKMFVSCKMDLIETKICKFRIKMKSYQDFEEFLKCIGSYQKIVNYQNDLWSKEFSENIYKRFLDTEWLTGEYILATYTNE